MTHGGEENQDRLHPQQHLCVFRMSGLCVCAVIGSATFLKRPRLLITNAAVTAGNAQVRQISCPRLHLVALQAFTGRAVTPLICLTHLNASKSKLGLGLRHTKHRPLMGPPCASCVEMSSGYPPPSQPDPPGPEQHEL